MRSLLGPLLNKAQISSTPLPGPRYGASGRGRVPMVNQMDAMGASAALFSIVNRTSTATAKVNWHMHEPAGPGDSCPECEDSEGFKRLDKHPALTVINKPNEFYTRQELFESGQQHIDLTGEGWLVVSYLGSVPYELWIARPDRMVVVTSPDEFLLGYLYMSPDGREIPLRKQDVLSMRMPAPMDPYRGMGPVQTIMAQVEGSSFSAEWNTNFYRNGARPGGIIKLRRGMPDKEFEKLVERFNVNHRGAANAGRLAFLEEGDWVDVKPMSIADMQLVETSNLSRDTILLAFGASKFDVGILEDVNRAASTAAAADFASRMTVPRLDRWKGMWNNDFLPLFPGGRPGREIVYCNPVPADREAARADKLAAAQAYAELVDAGVHPDDAAVVAGLPPMRTVARTPVLT